MRYVATGVLTSNALITTCSLAYLVRKKSGVQLAAFHLGTTSVIMTGLQARTASLRGLAKFKKIQKSKKNYSLPPSKLFFGNPSLTWTEHSNHHNQQLLAMYVQTEYTWYTNVLQNISTGLGLFWDDFKKKILNKTWTHPPTSIVISDFWKKNSLQSPFGVVT